MNEAPPAGRHAGPYDDAAWWNDRRLRVYRPRHREGGDALDLCPLPLIPYLHN